MGKKRPAHARNFKGNAQNIPPEDCFWLPYQQDWINDRSILKLMEKCRRSGISYCSAYEHVEEHALETARNDTYFSSRDESTAREVVRDVRKFSLALDRGAKYLGEQVIDPDKALSSWAVRFSSETNFFALSSNPDAFAGKGGNVSLDELALRADPRQCCSIAFPTMDWGGKVKIISTHRGTQNYFNELIEEILHKGNPKAISLHTVTLQDALDQGFLWKVQTMLAENDPRLQMDEAAYFDFIRNRCPDYETFLQEYMCVPSDDASAFMSYDLLTGCQYRADEKWEYSLDELAACGNQLFVGVDVGRDHDLTVIWVFEKVGGTYFTRKMVELRNEEFSAQEAELYPILGLPNMRRCCIDASGLGRQFAENARKRFGDYRVEEVKFTAPVKEELAYPYKAAFEDRIIRIPHCENLISDHRSIKKETTASGNIRFAADRGKNGHADRFWAGALGVHAGKTGEEPFHFTAPTRDAGDHFSRSQHRRSSRRRTGAIS